MRLYVCGVEFNSRNIGNGRFSVVEGDPRKGKTKLIGLIGKVAPGQYQIINCERPGLPYPRLADAMRAMLGV